MVVKAWLEFAGERTALALDAIDEAVDAVDVWTPALEAAAMVDPVGSKPGERVFLDDTTNDLEDAYRALSGLGSPPQPDLQGLDKSQAATLSVLAPHAWLMAGETLGTTYAPDAFDIAERLVRDAPDLLAKARLSTWPRAIVWLLAHRHRLVGPGEPLTPYALAADLSSVPGHPPQNRQTPHRHPSSSPADCRRLWGRGRMGRMHVRAPELRGRGWLNTGGRELSLADLRGRFVLLDFWTFCCINCLHVLDELRPLEEKYGDALVSSACTRRSSRTRRTRWRSRRRWSATRSHHPVLDDPELVTWQAYTARAWPTLVLVDPEGYIVAQYSGEGHAHALDAQLAELIAEHERRAR